MQVKEFSHTKFINTMRKGISFIKKCVALARNVFQPVTRDGQAVTAEPNKLGQNSPQVGQNSPQVGTKKIEHPQNTDLQSANLWSEAEVNYLLEAYPTTKDKVIAAVLGRSDMSVMSKARRMGLKKDLAFFREAGSQAKRNIRQRLAAIMAKKKELYEFSVDLYYNDLAPWEHRCVARFKDYQGCVHHERCKDFDTALEMMEIYIDHLIIEYKKWNSFLNPSDDSYTTAMKE
jgi:hypothetical protein